MVYLYLALALTDCRGQCLGKGAGKSVVSCVWHSHVEDGVELVALREEALVPRGQEVTQDLVTCDRPRYHQRRVMECNVGPG